MVKIIGRNPNPIQNFRNEYGKSPSNYLMECNTKLLKLGDLKKLNPSELEKRTEITKSMAKALKALAENNKILHGIK